MIEPALSAEEWGKRMHPAEGYNGRRDACAYLDDDRGDLFICAPSEDIYFGDSRHALAALALHGQPFGFTHLHAKALRVTCDNAERWIASRMFDPLDEAALEMARQARDLIEALLPPE